MLLFRALSCETPDEVLLEELLPRLQELFGSPALAEFLGSSVRGRFNGSINTHITFNAMILGGGYRLNEHQASELIEGWYNSVNLDEYPDDADLGMKFLREVIAEIVD